MTSRLSDSLDAFRPEPSPTVCRLKLALLGAIIAAAKKDNEVAEQLLEMLNVNARQALDLVADEMRRER